MTEPQRKEATCVWWSCCHLSVHTPAQPCSDQCRQRLCHSRKGLSERSWGRVGLIYLFSFKKPKDTLDIKKFRSKKSEKCSNMEAGSRSEPSSEVKTSLKPHTAITAGSPIPAPILLPADSICPAPGGTQALLPSSTQRLSARWSVPGTPLTYSSRRGLRAASSISG